MGLHLGNKISVLLLAVLLPVIKSKAQIVHWPIYTLNNKLWETNDTGTYYIILKNNKTCFNCYAELDKYINSISGHASLYCVTQVDSSVFSRKSQYKEVKNMMPNIMDVLFDYEDLNGGFGFTENIRKTSLYYQYKVDITPALIKIERNKIYYYSYQDIFSGSNIKNFLKN